MRWLLVAVIVAATATGDLLQSFEMKRHGEVCDFRPGKFAGLFRRRWLLLAVACMAVSFFAFLKLLSIAELSFAVPATAGTYVLETLLAKHVLRERIAPLRWVGALLVAGGVALVAL